MKLYHFTSVTLGESILSSAITNGHLMHTDNSMSHGVVWLTTDPRPGGHGLLRGNEKLDASQRLHNERATGMQTRNDVTHDKSQLRITVELDPEADPRLMSFMSYCKTYESKEWAKFYGLSCLVDIRRTPAKELQRLMRTASTKETTWWLSFNPVPTEAFVSVDFNVKGKFEPYDFERHGRAAMRRDGFAFPSPAALAEVAEIVQPLHRFEQPKALVFCEDPDKPPKVAVRGRLDDARLRDWHTGSRRRRRRRRDGCAASVDRSTRRRTARVLGRGPSNSSTRSTRIAAPPRRHSA